ncbi:MAG: sigma-70 family RNA polymerase sigma factor [Myxococcota bacterium]
MKGARISAERERELALRYRVEGDLAARNALVEAHIDHVAAAAQRTGARYLCLEDRIAEGHLGLLHALDKFDPDRGVRLWTYAVHWVRLFIGRAVRRSSSIVPGGLERDLRDRRKIARARTLALSEGVAGHDLADELARRTELSPRRIRAVQRRFAQGDTFLEGLDDALPCPVTPTPHDAVERRHRAEVVRRVLADAPLLEGERQVVEVRVLDAADERPSLAAVGAQMGVSREWVRKLEVSAKKKLRRRLSRALQPVAN